MLFGILELQHYNKSIYNMFQNLQLKTAKYNINLINLEGISEYSNNDTNIIGCVLWPRDIDNNSTLNLTLNSSLNSLFNSYDTILPNKIRYYNMYNNKKLCILSYFNPIKYIHTIDLTYPKTAWLFGNSQSVYLEAYTSNKHINLLQSANPFGYISGNREDYSPIRYASLTDDKFPELL